MTVLTATEMEVDVDMVVAVYPAIDGELMATHVYTALDGTALTVVLTDYQALELDKLWYGDDVAGDNYEARSL